MTSIKQIEANRKNAMKSTGPITEEGKGVVAQNALKHGILSAHVFIEDGEKTEYWAFCDAMVECLKPKSDFELLLVDRIISTAWRLRRVIHVEALMFQKAKEAAYSKSYRDAFSGHSAVHMATLSRYERALENGLYRAIRELRSLKEQEGLEVFEVLV